MVINKENGLFFFSGDEEKYNKTLQDFYNSSVLSQKKMESGLYDMEKYELEAHSLKGIAKSIGAEELARVANEHEEYAKKGKAGYVSDNFNEIIEVWDETLSDIEKMLGLDNISGTMDIKPNGSSLTHSELLEKIPEILKLLKNYDSDAAGNRLKKLLEYELPDSDHQLVLQAYEHIEDFEYEDTIEALEKLSV